MHKLVNKQILYCAYFILQILYMLNNINFILQILYMRIFALNDMASDNIFRYLFYININMLYFLLHFHVTLTHDNLICFKKNYNVRRYIISFISLITVRCYSM